MSFCDSHNFEKVKEISWSTKFDELNERYSTVEFECVDCGAKRWEVSETSSVFDW
jgi:hypothetical protein